MLQFVRGVGVVSLQCSNLVEEFVGNKSTSMLID